MCRKIVPLLTACFKVQKTKFSQLFYMETIDI